MKRFIFIIAVLLFSGILFAQKQLYYRHEVRASVGDAMLLWDNFEHVDYSVAYYYRALIWLWTGVNFVNYFGDKINYHWREYDTNGNFNDFSKSKTKYYAAIAPEIRFSYINKEAIICYSALSGGISWENGFDTKLQKYPKRSSYIQAVFWGLSCNFGKNKNIFLGGEFGFGYKGIFHMHGGYRF